MVRADIQQVIDEILEIEWEMMTAITAIDDPMGCTQDQATFNIMRTSQHAIWSKDTLKSYYADLKNAKGEHRNMIAEKYAHMMKVTSPVEYDRIKAILPQISSEVDSLSDHIVEVFMVWTEELDRKHSTARSLGRPTLEDGTWTSVDTYLKGELVTYSEKTLALCLEDVKCAQELNVNLSEQILENTAYYLGFDSLDDMEKAINEEV